MLELYARAVDRTVWVAVAAGWRACVEGLEERGENVVEESVRAGKIEGAIHAPFDCVGFCLQAARALLLRRHLRRAVLAAVVVMLVFCVLFRSGNLELGIEAFRAQFAEAGKPGYLARAEMR